MQGLERRAEAREADREAGLGQAIDREHASGLRPCAAIVRMKRRQSSAEIGSAPLKIRRTADRSSCRRASARAASGSAGSRSSASTAPSPHPARQLEPEQRPAREQLGAHDRVARAGGEHVEVKADQAHVVRQGHPAQGHVTVRIRGRLDDRGDVRAQVAVRQQHALGIAGRARGILDEGEAIRLGLERAARRAADLERAGNDGARTQRLASPTRLRRNGERLKRSSAAASMQTQARPSCSNTAPSFRSARPCRRARAAPARCRRARRPRTSRRSVRCRRRRASSRRRRRAPALQRAEQADRALAQATKAEHAAAGSRLR